VNVYVAIALEDLADAHPDGVAVQAALRLALHAREISASGPGTADWALFGTGLASVYADLHADTPPLSIHIRQSTLVDSSRVRRETARLTTTVAALLQTASTSRDADPTRRWRWATAATKLESATAYLREPR
jgi:hypothetical protein